MHRFHGSLGRFLSLTKVWCPLGSWCVGRFAWSFFTIQMASLTWGVELPEPDKETWPFRKKYGRSSFQVGCQNQLWCHRSTHESTSHTPARFLAAENKGTRHKKSKTKPKGLTLTDAVSLCPLDLLSQQHAHGRRDSPSTSMEEYVLRLIEMESTS